MRLRYERLLPLYHLIWRRWREQRWARFQMKLTPAPQDHVLDVGGNPNDWAGRKSMVNNVDVLNLESCKVEQNENSPFVRSLKGDGCALEFNDTSYDIVYSNSVIEHVGSWEDQETFAAETRRVGRKLWIQTPAYECPVEPHYLGLFIHWFPSNWHTRIARWTSVIGLTGAADLETIAKTTRLLTKREFRLLYPDCEIWTERMLWIIPKSYVAIRA